ncbi:hypothetical protein ABIE67_009752 [Streptomyces sp. V4I8]|uniref:hypothetical protein n=1 Tax=Streptomyces sp. V4I8 TaxID=3156469 RepID=UPI00351914D0
MYAFKKFPPTRCRASRAAQWPPPAKGAVMLPVQRPFRLDDLGHVRLAARGAGNPFFETALVHEPYSRVVFVGRGLLFVTRQTVPRPGWRVHLAFFTSLPGGAWFAVFPHPDMHVSAGAAG